MEKFLPKRIKMIREMLDVSELERIRKHSESILNCEEEKYTIEEFVDYISEGEYFDWFGDDLDEYIESTLRIQGIILTKDNSLFNQMCCQRREADKKIINKESLNEQEKNLTKLMIYTFKMKVHWGMYDGSTIKDIIVKNPEYILWCIIHLDHFYICGNIFAMKAIRESGNFLKAIEINSIKGMIDFEWTYEEEVDYDRGGDFDAFERDHLSWFNYNQ